MTAAVTVYTNFVDTSSGVTWNGVSADPGHWIIVIHAMWGGSITAMGGDPAELDPSWPAGAWQLLAQVDGGSELAHFRVWAMKSVDSVSRSIHLSNDDGASAENHNHLYTLSGVRDADDASDVFSVGVVDSAAAGTSQVAPLYSVDGSELLIGAWLSGAVSNYTLTGLTARTELDGTISTSRTGETTLSTAGPSSLTATNSTSASWAAVTIAVRQPATGSVTFPTQPLKMKAEIAPGANPGQDPAYWAGLWTDISDDVWMRDGGVTITRGRQDETSQISPSSMALTVNNEAGQFVRLNPSSPYYGMLTKNLPVQLWVDPGDGWRLRYRGYLSEYPPRSQGGQVDEHMPLQASGITRRLSRGRILNSPLYRAILAGSFGTVTGYWPLETDGVSAVAGQGNMKLTGDVSFGAGGPAGSAGQVSTKAGAKLSAPVIGMPDTGGWSIGFFMEIPDDFDTANDLSIQVTWSTPGSTYTRWLIELNSSEPGVLIMGVFEPSIGEFAINGFVNLVGKGPFFVGARAQSETVGGDPAIRYGFVVTGDGFHEGWDGFTDVDFASPIQSVGINTEWGPTDDPKGSVSHLVVGPDHQLLPDYPLMTAPGSGYTGERAADRMRRLSAEENIPIVIVGDDGASEPMGPQPVDRFVTILQDIEDTDGGMLYERRDGRLGYQTRNARYNASTVLALDYSAGDVAPPLEPTDDDQSVVNDFTASRDGGGAARVIDQAHINANGQYADSSTVNVADDDQLADQAGWRVHEGTADGLRYPAITPNLNGRPAALIPAWADGDVGQPATITNPGRDLPPGQIDVVVEGYTETIDVVSWTATANCTPGDAWKVIVANDPTLGRADTAGSALASSATSTATSLSVATTSGPLWTTDPSDLPFDINVGGEVMTVLDAANRITDAFTRSVSSGWGTADTGQAWTVSGGTAANYSVTGSTGRVSCTDVTTRRFTSLGSGITAASVAATVTVPVVATGDTITAGIVLRYTDDNNHYLLQLTFATDGTITTEIFKRISGTYTNLAATTGVMSYTAALPVRMRAQAVGTALAIRVWAADQEEPGEWHATAVDSTYTSGKVGTKTALGAGNTNTLPVAIDYGDFDMLTPAITGTTSPQTVKVVRSVNGVSKAHVAGEDVRLAVMPVLSF